METEDSEIVSVLDRKLQPSHPLHVVRCLSRPLDEAFAAKHMPDLGHDVKEFQVFHWKLQGWKKLGRKLTSPEFDCGGYKWKILLFPFGNLNDPPGDVVSVYLDSANTKGMGKDWHVCAQLALVISNPQYPTIYTANHTHHRFIIEEPDWGFTRFSDLRGLFQPQPGRDRLTIEGDSTVVSAYVRVLKDPTSVMWHTFINYDSKGQTRYVGLKKQDTTGCMNPLLQSLFHTHYFRRTSDKPVGTNELTRSIGWTPYLFSQHNLPLFNGLLRVKLESKMKGTRAEGAVAKHFVGEIKSYIESPNVSHESAFVQQFNDIQLNVKGIQTLYDSFRDYVTVERLDGITKYHRKGFGSQNFQKRITFQSLPSVLHLQLKRYGWDIQLDAMVKINDRFEFPFEIDLDEFFDKTTDRSKPWKYKLHSVLVHSGGFRGGDYFAFIKPDRDTWWHKFKDDQVTPVTDREVLEESYGGESLDGVKVRATKGSTNAYMLVYIRETAIDEVLAPLTEKDTPPHLGLLTIKVVTDETFSLHQGFDLAETYSVFKSRVAQQFGYPKSQIRLWVLVNRTNITVRPYMHIPENEPSSIEVTCNDVAFDLGYLRLYLEILPDLSKKILSDNAGTIIVFLKHFDTTRQSLFGIGKVHVPRSSKVSDLIPIINERMRWVSGTPLKLYEEVEPGRIVFMEPRYTFTQNEIQDGDIICFQVEISGKEVHDLESQGLYSNPPQFYEFLRNRVIEPDERKGSPTKPVSESADLDQPDTREKPSLGAEGLGTVLDIGAQQQQQHGRTLAPAASLSQILWDPEPAIERHVNEMDDRLGNYVLLDRERRKLFNELCKTCSRHCVIPKSMHIPDCSEGSVEVECGGSANVLQSTYKGHRVAIKVIHSVYASNLDVIRSRFCREVVAWRHLRHPNILPLLGVTTSGHRFAMISQWMEDGNISQFIEKDRHVNCVVLLVDVANGLKYLHDLRIVHGDLKGVFISLESNILISNLSTKANILINKDRRACVADFGLTAITGVVTHAAARSSQASLTSNESLMSFTGGGTYRWMSSELLDPERFGIPQSEDNRPTRQSDCYALGMVIYEVLCGHHPYVEIQSDILVVNAIMEGVRPEKPVGATHLGFTEKLWRILESCWLEDRSARPSVEDILFCLSDVVMYWYTREF
ncbi:hypothetical protein BDM02DRAFT_3186537 [Thelephora ganbajun]|uniref:Uncharacterized protein n=1 Tax=Thelephora ganbajun TaxID=370292 RepID=A0ACB6ZHX2_THEGA|nr:hypothetical protein BDM02DRAFT_3186537 [Thelephora ganbajun]